MNRAGESPALEGRCPSPGARGPSQPLASRERQQRPLISKEGHLMFSTTVYEPAEDGHRFTSEEPTGDCTVCGGHSWDKQHQLSERFISDAVEPRAGLYCVEASDNRGRDYSTNGLRWEDVEDAKRWAGGLALRWFGCTNIRVRATDETGDPTGDTVHQTL